MCDKDVEANTVRLKEHEQPVLVLEKSPRASTLGNIKYVLLCVCVCVCMCVLDELSSPNLSTTAYYPHLSVMCVSTHVPPVLFRYTVISGTPEKILEHFLETMSMDTHHSEPGRESPEMEL